MCHNCIHIYHATIHSMIVCRHCMPHAPQLPLQIHPIFVLSLVDCVLAVSYIIGGFLWLRRLKVSAQVWCYVTSLLTIVGIVWMSKGVVLHWHGAPSDTPVCCCQPHSGVCTAGLLRNQEEGLCKHSGLFTFTVVITSMSAYTISSLVARLLVGAWVRG